MDYSQILNEGYAKTLQTTTAATTTSSRLGTMEQPNKVRQDQVEHFRGERRHKQRLSLNSALETSEQNLLQPTSPLHDYQNILQPNEKEHRRPIPQMQAHSPDIIQNDDDDGDEWEKSFIGSSSTVASNPHQRKDNIDDLTKRYARSLPTAASLVNLMEYDDQDNDLDSLPDPSQLMDGIFY